MPPENLPLHYIKPPRIRGLFGPYSLVFGQNTVKYRTKFSFIFFEHLPCISLYKDSMNTCNPYSLLFKSYESVRIREIQPDNLPLNYIKPLRIRGLLGPHSSVFGQKTVKYRTRFSFIFFEQLSCISLYRDSRNISNPYSLLFMSYEYARIREIIPI